MKPLIHFAHANGVPSLVYRKLFDLLKDDFDIIYVPLLGTDRRYPIDDGWKSLTQQVIDSIVQQAKGRPVIGLGHSLGSVVTFQAAYQRPELFQQVIMLDPPLIVGKASLLMHLTKMFNPKLLDKITPANLSLKRRDHWESRQQAYDLLRPKGFYQLFDEQCFQDYIDYALTDDPVHGGVTLTISKYDEVEIFRTNTTKMWLPMLKPPVDMHLVVGRDSPFLKQKFPQQLQKKLSIPFSITDGGHMFPLEHPKEVVDLVKSLIQKSS
ncbi:alpha/beta fold hydrolase [Acinetobacter shaoyimingii]|uniref:Alpha/beta hydrolase n=1 Tax=Acinetobacter shaoyimingii TaxID=2715164 RepID=A0A6G8RUD8_9GAMM|nr:alpha/beta hydrolase [Acinetobacter shaoyimingii]NHB58468.1 alpha/beta hydrolase [Acinetobacter shaoyimingii]QIO05440.1 alpha/beta hydrolase [Acinetobacter shaoyimingii]